jgi:hypothetical protein
MTTPSAAQIGLAAGGCLGFIANQIIHHVDGSRKCISGCAARLDIRLMSRCLQRLKSF